MTSMVRYGNFSIDTMNKQSAVADALGGADFLKLVEGANVLRFLPPLEGQDSPFRITAMHYIDAVPGLPNKKLVFACPQHELKQACPACQRAAELSRSLNPIDREQGKKFAAGLRIYANVIDRNNPDAGPRVLAFGKQIWDQLKSILNNPRSGGNFLDPTEKGFDIVINRKGTGQFDTEYTCLPDRNNSPLHVDDAIAQEIIDMQHDLESHVTPIVPEELVAAWHAAALRAPQGGGAAPAGRQLPAAGGAPRAGAGLMAGRGAAPVARQPAPAETQRQVIPASGSAVDDAEDFGEDDDFNA